MNFNHYKLHKHSHDQMQKYLQEAERSRMIEIASSTGEKLNRVSGIFKKMKKWVLETLHVQARPEMRGLRRTGSYPKSSST